MAQEQHRGSPMRAGTGGLSGRDGEPIRDPGGDTGYRPEASVTGQVKGPMVDPAGKRPEVIISEIEREKPVNIDSPVERWWKPHTARSVPVWPEIKAKIEADMDAMKFFNSISSQAQIDAILRRWPKRFADEYRALAVKYEKLMDNQGDLYLSPNDHGRAGFASMQYAAFVCYCELDDSSGT